MSLEDPARRMFSYIWYQSLYLPESDETNLGTVDEQPIGHAFDYKGLNEKTDSLEMPRSGGVGRTVNFLSIFTRGVP